MNTLALVRPGTSRLQHLAATANRAHRSVISQALIAGQALLEAKEIVGHGGWAKWIEQHCVFSERTARVYMQVARNPKTAGTADSLVDALDTLKAKGRYAFCSGDEEWFTPKTIVDAARSVLGRIDLDPASCQQANAVVKAGRYFTVKDDGLRQAWRGRVFLNPPYSRVKIQTFIEKLIAHVENGTVTEAIVVVNSEVEVKWFRSLAAVSAAVCFPTGRVRFWKPGKGTGTSPLGQAIVYAGRRPKKFERAVRRFGHVWFA